MLVSILRIFRFFWDIRKTGFYEILSPFVYLPQNKTFYFRTVIYLDADFYNFIPDMNKIAPEEDQDFAEFYMQCYKEHIKKIYVFLDNMNQGTSLWGNILVLPILIALNANVFVDIYEWIFLGLVPDFAQEFMLFVKTGTLKKELLSLFMNILTLTGAFSIRNFLTSLVMKLLIRMGLLGAKIYKKRKARKQAALKPQVA